MCALFNNSVCDMGVGVNARGSDGYYATVYCRCFIFYGRQYVSYSIYCISEEFHSRMKYLSFRKFEMGNCEYDCNTH